MSGGSRRTLVIGVGGPTSSGKTTLAKHLLSLLPAGKCVMLHQDDFALPEEQLPWNEKLQARDWDSPVGTIDYRRMEKALHHFRQHGELPAHHSSHDHLNEQPKLLISESSSSRWRAAFEKAFESNQIDKVLIADGFLLYYDEKAFESNQIDKVLIADGFLLYYDEKVRREMDIRLFLRCNRSTLIDRRESRGGYATAEGTVWQDPPGYFEHVIWPGYVQAHQGMFEEGDVERGRLIQPANEIHGDGTAVKGLVLFETESLPLQRIVDVAAEEIERGLQTQQ